MVDKDYRTITLREHGYLEVGDGKHNTLSAEEFDELKGYIQKIDALEGEGKEGDKKYKAPFKILDTRMKALNYVGAILTSKGTNIEILPKIDLGKDDDSKDSIADTKRIFIHMLKVYLGRHHRQFDTGVWGNPELPLLEVFITVFLQEVSHLVRRGLARAYIPHEENLTCLKGKLDFTNHIKHNLFHKERFYVNYDEFSIDRPINRVIKQALMQVSKVSNHPDNYRRAKQLLNYFDDVSNTRDWKHEVKISNIDRSVSFKSYTESFTWAQLILQNFSPDNWKGNKETIALLFPMEMIFEGYISHILEEGIRSRASHWSFSRQNTTHKIMSEDNGGVTFTIKPDLLVADKNNQRSVILDTKWKRIDGDNTNDKYGISQGDIYQLYSYGKVYQRKDENAKHTSLVLLYPQNDNFSKVIELREDGHQSLRHDKSLDKAESLSLKIFPIDLSGLADKNSAKIKEAEMQIARGIIEECIPGEEKIKEQAS